MENTIVTILFAGLGNKFASLVSGHALARKLNKNFIIYNINDKKWQSLDYKLIYDFNQNYIEVSDIEDIDKMIDISIPAFSRNKFNFKRECFEIKQIDSAKNFDSFLFLSHRPINLSEDDILHFSKDFIIKPHIKDKIESFINLHNLDENVCGLHVRATDVPFRNLNIQFAEHFIKENKSKKIFLCTDEKEVELNLSKYDNVFFRKKLNYVQKLKDVDPWEKQYQSTDYNFRVVNAIRQSDCEIEAFIDMILLSRTNIIDCSKIVGYRSTFCDWASKFSSIKKL